MPRTARIDIPGILQHVMVRGIEKSDIFLDDDDRTFFLKRLSFLLGETETTCLAWALMPNHFHLLLRPRTGKLSTVMRRLLTSYAVYFNKRHDRVGHLFQNRYKSIVCDEESYLLELIRYIHLNPLRSGIVKDMEELAHYPWSGHAVLMGRKTLPGQEIGEILSRFDKQPHIARHDYRDFLDEGFNTKAKAGSSDNAATVHIETKKSSITDKPGECKESRPGPGDETVSFNSLNSLRCQLLAFATPPHSDVCDDSRILGTSLFARNILQHEQEKSTEQPASIATDQNHLSELLTTVANFFNISEDSLRHKNRLTQVTTARGIFCYLSVRRHGFKAADIARTLHLTRSGVCLAIRRGEKILEESPNLRKSFRVLN